MFCSARDISKAQLICKYQRTQRASLLVQRIHMLGIKTRATQYYSWTRKPFWRISTFHISDRKSEPRARSRGIKSRVLCRARSIAEGTRKFVQSPSKRCTSSKRRPTWNIHIPTYTHSLTGVALSLSRTSTEWYNKAGSEFWMATSFVLEP